jgi:hypothetical protein
MPASWVYLPHITSRRLFFGKMALICVSPTAADVAVRGAGRARDPREPPQPHHILPHPLPFEPTANFNVPTRRGG